MRSIYFVFASLPGTEEALLTLLNPFMLENRYLMVKPNHESHCTKPLARGHGVVQDAAPVEGLCRTQGPVPGALAVGSMEWW